MNGIEFPQNVIGTMFRILKACMTMANALVDNLFMTPSAVISEWLADANTPDWLNTFLTTLIEINIPFIAHLTIFDFLVGSSLMLVLIIGIVKYFGDAMGL